MFPSFEGLYLYFKWLQPFAITLDTCQCNIMHYTTCQCNLMHYTTCPCQLMHGTHGAHFSCNHPRVLGYPMQDTWVGPSLLTMPHVHLPLSIFSPFIFPFTFTPIQIYLQYRITTSNSNLQHSHFASSYLLAIPSPSSIVDAAPSQVPLSTHPPPCLPLDNTSSLSLRSPTSRE